MVNQPGHARLLLAKYRTIEKYNCLDVCRRLEQLIMHNLVSLCQDYDAMRSCEGREPIHLKSSHNAAVQILAMRLNYYLS